MGRHDVLVLAVLVAGAVAAAALGHGELAATLAGAAAGYARPRTPPVASAAALALAATFMG